MGQEIDRETLKLAQHGDNDAWKELIRTYRRRVFEFHWYRWTPNRNSDAADELTAATFAAVSRSLSKFNPDGSAKLSTWLLTIARNVRIDAMRKENSTIDTVPLEIAPSDNMPAQGAELDTRLDVAAALAQLETDTRDLLVLGLVLGHSMAEMSLILNIPINTVKSRLHRAKQKFRIVYNNVINGRILESSIG